MRSSNNKKDKELHILKYGLYMYSKKRNNVRDNSNSSNNSKEDKELSILKYGLYMYSKEYNIRECVLVRRMIRLGESEELFYICNESCKHYNYNYNCSNSNYNVSNSYCVRVNGII